MGIRLHITAEGQTEERFVKNVLAPFLGEREVWVDARCVLTSKHNRGSAEFRGGWRRTSAYAAAKKDICTWMKEDQNADARFTTMFDLYALPSDFPAFTEAKHESDPYRRVEMLENALADDINGELADTRFVPYIQLHEFEALILADPEQLEWEFLEHEAPIRNLVDMVALEGGNPELIDDGPCTAPSKRIISEIREYEDKKATSGPLVAGIIGMKKLRERCRHFADWIEALAALGQ